ncbi:MAG: hypothetical protein GXY83_12390 [Rhodopirellula sp.]|nr:hypothetical protein [Rhodopirellula sp.]
MRPGVRADPAAKPRTFNFSNPGWYDCGEGPFDTADEATAFAAAEVGAGWIVVDPEGRPLVYGDGTGARYRPRQRTVGLDPFGLSPTTTLGNERVESQESRVESQKKEGKPSTSPSAPSAASPATSA